MKTLILFTLFLVNSIAIFGQVNSNYHYVNGYTRQDGTQVKGYYRTDPNTTNTDNYSTKPNVNPWTGEPGTIEPDNYTYPSYSTPTYTPSNTPTYTPSSSTYSGSSYNSYNYNSSNSMKTEEIQYHNKYSFEDKLTIEKLLFNLGYNPGSVDGIITDSTIYAIQLLQSFIGVQSDGKFGDITLNKLIEISETNQ
ncbi:putative peptidoglycan binding domain protein [compost metagenome]